MFPCNAWFGESDCGGLDGEGPTMSIRPFAFVDYLYSFFVSAGSTDH